jgi:carbamate kinase
MLARELEADLLLISTSVERVALDFGRPEQRWVDELTLEQVRGYLAEGTHFAAGSMGPKMAAVVAFLDGGGEEAIITDPPNIARALAGEAGTRIVR